MFIAWVVSGVLLLSALAVSVLSTGATSYRLARNALHAARSEAAVEAAVVRAVLGLLDARPEHRWRVDGTPHELTFDGVRMRIAIQDELGRIDLNHADRPLIAGLFRAAGLGADAAGSLADKILDWREAGPGKRLSGVRAPDYRAADLSYGPRGGPFQSVEEIKLVMGMTPDLYQRVEPALTVYSARPFVDPQFAPAIVLAPCLGRDAVRRPSSPHAQARAAAPGSSRPALRCGAGRSAFALRSNGRGKRSPARPSSASWIAPLSPIGF